MATSSSSSTDSSKYFSRSPRFVVPIPHEIIEIPEPPQEPAEPANSLLYSLIPMAITVLALVVVSLVANMRTLLYFSVPLMLSSAIGSWFIFQNQKKDYKKKVEVRTQKYGDLLRASRAELQERYREQDRTRKLKDPSPSDCLQIAQDCAPGLWSRSPNDDDFLSVRVGLGDIPATVEIKVPSSKNPIAPDPMIEDARKMVRPFETLQQVPLCVDLRESKVLGIAGERRAVLDATFVLIQQLTIHHAPNEVKLAALIPESEYSQWEWIRWLPHVWNDDRQFRYLAATPPEAMELMKRFELILDERRRYQEESANKEDIAIGSYYILLIGDAEIVEQNHILYRIQTEGAKYGIIPVFLSSRSTTLPQQCQSIVRLRREGSFVRMTYPASVDYPLIPDQIKQAELTEYARSLAPLRLHASNKLEIPQSVSLLDLFSVSRVADLNVEQRWANNRKSQQSLVAPIGMTAGNQLQMLDLHERADGTNGLVAGMVGAGKSELLQTLIASLAINYPPDRLGFVLVDFKGGSMTRPFRNLPHTFGIITDLEHKNLAARAIRSFDVELDRRKKEFNLHEVTHIDQYQKLYFEGKATTPLPYLVVVVDEFAEMKAEQPETAQEFVRIARTGRAFGLRLILAMQKPAGIVDGQIEANTRFRLCLRVAQTEDSQAMLKRSDAAYLKGIGRAYLQIGANEVFREFQVGYGGAMYDPDGLTASDPKEIVQIGLNGMRRVLSELPSVGETKEISQLDAVVEELIRIPHGIPKDLYSGLNLWLPPLEPTITLEKILFDYSWDNTSSLWNPSKQWMSPVVGLVDKPSEKRQELLTIPLAEGHLAVYGAPGYGKTNVIQSLVISLAYMHSPADVAIYILDFGGQLLKQQFKDMPHVRGAVNSDEEERIGRLFFKLRQELQGRKRLLGNAGVSSFQQYRKDNLGNEPAIILIVENFSGFAQTYQEREDYIDTLTRIAQDGVGLGIHLVLTSTSPTGIRYSIANNMLHAVALYLIEPSEYGSVVGRLEEYPPVLPGRGLVRGNPALECQIALPMPGEVDQQRSQEIMGLATRMKNAWGPHIDMQIPTMPEYISFSQLLKDNEPDADLSVPLGFYALDLSTLQLAVSDSHVFLVTGSVQSGKSTLLQNWIMALSQQYTEKDIDILVFDSYYRGLTLISDNKSVSAYSSTHEQAESLLVQLEKVIEDRAILAASLEKISIEPSYIAVVIDDIADDQYGSFLPAQRDRLPQLIRRGQIARVTFIVAGNTGDIYSKYSDTVRVLKEVQTGFVLGGSDDRIFNMRLPHSERNITLPPGEGYYIKRGKAQKVKLANPVEALQAE